VFNNKKSLTIPKQQSEIFEYIQPIIKI